MLLHTIGAAPVPAAATSAAGTDAAASDARPPGVRPSQTEGPHVSPSASGGYPTACDLAVLPSRPKAAQTQFEVLIVQPEEPKYNAKCTFSCSPHLQLSQALHQPVVHLSQHIDRYDRN